MPTEASLKSMSIKRANDIRAEAEQYRLGRLDLSLKEDNTTEMLRWPPVVCSCVPAYPLSCISLYPLYSCSPLYPTLYHSALCPFVSLFAPLIIHLCFYLLVSLSTFLCTPRYPSSSIFVSSYFFVLSSLPPECCLLLEGSRGSSRTTQRGRNNTVAGSTHSVSI